MAVSSEVTVGKTSEQHEIYSLLPTRKIDLLGSGLRYASLRVSPRFLQGSRDVRIC